MSPASAAPTKSVRTNGFRKRADRINRKPQSEEADRLLDLFRTELFDLKGRLGWSYKDFVRKMPRYHSRQAVESTFKRGGFRGLVELARAMGVRVRIELQ